VIDPEHGQPAATAPAPAPAPVVPPNTVAININGQAYDVAPEVARNYYAEVSRREAAARVQSAPPPPVSDPDEDVPLPAVDYNLIYTNPDALRAAVDARAEAIAERKTRELEDAVIAQRDADATEAARVQVWDTTVNRFYEENPDLNTDAYRPLVRTVWKENQAELGALTVTPGLQRLSQLTRGYMANLGIKPGADVRAPALASSRGAPAPARTAPEDDKPGTMGDWIREKAALRRKAWAKDDA